jgi:hypothetical protein
MVIYARFYGTPVRYIQLSQACSSHRYAALIGAGAVCDEHALRTTLTVWSWRSGLGALRNAEHSHALAGDNYLLCHACPRTSFLFLFNLVFR